MENTLKIHKLYIKYILTSVLDIFIGMILSFSLGSITVEGFWGLT